MRLTIVVPCFNHAHVLRNCLTPAVEEADKVLFIDDGSTDDSFSVAKEFGPKIEAIKLPNNIGVNGAVNVGLWKVETPYVAFAAADDRIAPGFGRTLTALLDAYPAAGLAYGASRWKDTATGAEWVSADEAEFGYLSELRGRRIVSHATVFRTRDLRETGGFNESLRWHSDWFACYSVAIECGFAYSPNVLSEIHLHRHSYYASRDKAKHRQVLRNIIRLFDARGYLPHHAHLLSQFGIEIVHPLSEYRGCVTFGFLLRAARRQLEMSGRKILPPVAARWVAKYIR